MFVSKAYISNRFALIACHQTQPEHPEDQLLYLLVMVDPCIAQQYNAFSALNIGLAETTTSIDLRHCCNAFVEATQAWNKQ